MYFSQLGPFLVYLSHFVLMGDWNAKIDKRQGTSRKSSGNRRLVILISEFGLIDRYRAEAGGGIPYR